MLRVATLNLNYYVEKHGPWPARKKIIVEQLRSLSPDIILFQAVAQHPDIENGLDQGSQVAEALGEYKSHVFEPAQRAADGTLQGNATIARPLFTTVKSHTLSFLEGLDDPNRRVLLQTSINTTDGILDIYNAHFSWNENQSTKNVEEAVGQFNTHAAHILLGGDLNTEHASPAFLPFEKSGFSDVWSILHGGKNGLTFESDKPSLRIDYFWASNGLQRHISRIQTFSAPPDSAVRLSDHHGLLLELSLDLA